MSMGNLCYQILHVSSSNRATYPVPLLQSGRWSFDFLYLCSTAAAKSLQSCLTLCNPMDCSPPGSPVPGILQARTLEWGCHFFLQCMKVNSESEVAQLCPTLSDPMDCSLPGSSVHGIFSRQEYWSGVPLPSPLSLFQKLINSPMGGL